MKKYYLCRVKTFLIKSNHSMKRIILCCFMLCAFAFTASAQYKVTQEHKDRAAEVVKKMTLDEKIAYVGG